MLRSRCVKKKYVDNLANLTYVIRRSHTIELHDLTKIYVPSQEIFFTAGSGVYHG
jgi:hypothetical protein